MDLFDPKHLIETFGTIGLILIVYAESGILIGLILPGDSLLFTAGLLASQNKFGLNIGFIAGGAFIVLFFGVALLIIWLTGIGWILAFIISAVVGGVVAGARPCSRSSSDGSAPASRAKPLPGVGVSPERWPSRCRAVTGTAAASYSPRRDRSAATRRSTPSSTCLPIRWPAGNPIGVKVTLRGERMWDFLERTTRLALPRIRDFRGVPGRSFDGRGNYSLGLREQLAFPEIDYDKVDRLRGLEISIVTTAKTDEESKKLLELLGMPFAS